jgi:hypothetical protein
MDSLNKTPAQSRYGARVYGAAAVALGQVEAASFA